MPSPWPNTTGLSTGAITTGGHGLRAHMPGRPWLRARGMLLQLQICFHVCFCWNQCTNLLPSSLFFAGTNQILLPCLFAGIIFVPLFCYNSFGFLLLPALSFVTSFFMRLSRPCACVFCYNLVLFLLQPSTFFATTGEAPSWTTSYFCYNRFVVCCNQCQFLLPPTSLIFLEPALDFLFLLPLAFRFAGTSFNFCYHQVFGLLECRRFFLILLPTFYYLLEPSRIFATAGGIFCCDWQIKDEEQHELYNGCCGR
ncbi:hypothetical protein VPH35_043191 [Triticum aestivum]